VKQITFLNKWFDNTFGAQIESLGAHGGFSGADFWRVSMPDCLFCLRRWPKEHPTIDRLNTIHGLLRHVEQAGFDLAPVPLRTQTGKTFFLNEDHLWDLTPWMPGEANFRQQPRAAKLAAAMQTLANLHDAARSYNQPAAASHNGPSPGLQRRLECLHSLQQGELEQLWKAARTAEASELREVALHLLEGITCSIERVTKDLEPIAAMHLPQQWCLRDVWHDHVLFEEDRVSGIIDFGAVAVDSVAGDVARLLGSMVDDDPDGWRAGIDAYSQHRPLSWKERRALAGFDASGMLGSAANWVRWLFVQRRRFSQVRTVHSRLLWLRQRLHALASRKGASVAAQD